MVRDTMVRRGWRCRQYQATSLLLRPASPEDAQDTEGLVGGVFRNELRVRNQELHWQEGVTHSQSADLGKYGR